MSDSHDGQPSHFRVLAEHFSAFASLSAAEMRLLGDLAEAARYHPPYRDLYVAGASPPPPRMIVAGWACQYRLLSDGHRQIVSLKLPGDLIWPVMPLRLPSSCAVAALTELETVSAQPLVEAAAAADPAHPGLAYAIRVMAHLHDMLLYDQIVRLGRQTACGRFAHLMLELRERLDRVGLADGDSFAMPLTQDVLADVLGFSVVHVNRTVQQLRRERLLDIRNGTVTLTQPAALQELAGWMPLPGAPGAPKPQKRPGRRA
jgi:CRP-like cAMP-binding protein